MLIDLDGNGKIDFNEFYVAVVDYKKTLTMDKIDWFFREFDSNGDGQISIEEFKQALPSKRFGLPEIKLSYAYANDDQD